MVSSEDEYLESINECPDLYPGKRKLFEDHFEFNSLSYSVYRRFIELLLPITNHFFRKTSKHNYQQCLDLRGIEVGDLRWDSCDKYHGKLSVFEGELTLNLNKVRKDWTRYLSVTRRFIFCRRHPRRLNKKQLNFAKKYEYLIIEADTLKYAECLIHPNLRDIYINGEWMLCDEFFAVLNKLSVCKDLECVFVSDFRVKPAENFKKLKHDFEEFYRRHQPSLVDCSFNNFKIHEGVLCYVSRVNGQVKDATFEYLRRL